MRLLGIMLLCLSLQLAATTVEQGAFSYQKQELPDWVELVAYQKAASNKEPVTYLFVDEQVNWLDSEFKAYSRVVMQPNTRRGVEQASQYHISFAPEYQQLILHSIRIVRAGESREQLDIADIRLVQREQEHDRQIYTGYVTAMVLLSDLQPGDILDLQYSLHGFNPIYGGKRSAYFPLNWSVPVQQSQLRLLTKAQSLPYVTNQAKMIPERRQHNDVVEYRWQQQQVAAVNEEDRLPAWYKPYQFIEFNEFGHWQDVVTWAQPLYQNNEPLLPELQQKVQRWRQQSQNDEAFVEQVVRFVQNDIRYFGIEIGLNSHQPFSPNTVYQRRYGDCKDKTTLMIALLAAGGIESYPALVSHGSRGSIVHRLPGPIVFDHVITYLNLNGTDYWLDGTRAQQYGSLQQKGRQYYQQALVIKDGVNQLTAVPVPAEIDAVSYMQEHFELQAVGAPVRLNVTLTLEQYEATAFRVHLDQQGVREYARFLERVYQRTYPGAELLKDPQIDDDRALNIMKITAEFQIEDFWDDNGPRQELKLFGDLLSDYTQLPGQVRRQMPYYIEPNALVIQEVNFKLGYPIRWQLGDLSVEIDDPAFHYQREVAATPLTISVKHQYRSKSDHVKPEQAVNYANTLRRVRDALFLTVQIDRVDPNAISQQQMHDVIRETLQKVNTP